MGETNINAFYAVVLYERLRDHKSATIEQWWNIPEFDSPWGYHIWVVIIKVV